jgi:hypothetical protein
MTHKIIIDYFEQLNLNLNDFAENSFFRLDLREIEGAIRTGITYPCMAVESPDIDPSESTVNSSAIGRWFAFAVYMNPELDNQAEQTEMLDLCERICLKILARMRHDARIPEHPLYNKFLISSCSGMKIGPVFTEMLYGYRFTGMIKGSESLKVNAADWADIDLTC